MGWNCMKSTRRVLGYLLLHSLAPHCSLRSRAPLRSFVRPRTPLHSFVRSLAHSLQSTWESDLCLWIECINFMRFQPTASRWSVAIVCSFVIVQITILHRLVIVHVQSSSSSCHGRRSRSVVDTVASSTHHHLHFMCSLPSSWKRGFCLWNECVV